VIVNGGHIPSTQGLGLSRVQLPEIPDQSPGLHPKANTDGELATYTVQSGDNPWLISNKISIPVDTLMRTNNLNKKSILGVGDLIYYFPK
jgi:hypothetical protein